MSRSKPKKQNPKPTPKPNPAPVALTDADIERLTKAITSAIIEAEQQKGKTADSVSPPKRKSIKDILRVFFYPIRKLKTENSALSLVRSVTSIVCWCIAGLGYIIAIVLFLKGIYELISNFSAAFIFVALLDLLFAAVIWLLSRLMAATACEMEKTNSETLIFGIASFILAIIAIVVSMIGQ